MNKPFGDTELHSLTLAGRAMGKILKRGHRGLERCTEDELMAMAAGLAILGLRPLEADEHYGIGMEIIVPQGEENHT